MAKRETAESLKTLDKKLDSINKKITTSTKKITEGVEDSYDISIDKAGELLKNLEKQLDLEEGINELVKQQAFYTDKANSFIKDSNKDKKKQAELMAASAKWQAEQAKNALELIKTRQKELELTDEQIAQNAKIKKFEKERLDLIKESLGFVDDITNAIEDIPIVGGMLSKMLGTEDLKEKLTSIVTSELAEFNAGSKTAKEAFGNIGKSALKLLGTVGAIAAAVKLIEFAVDIDKETTELSRNLGTSKDFAKALRKEMVEVSKASDNVLMTITNQSKAMEELVAASGGLNSITKDMVENQVLLTKNLGVSSESASILNTLFKAQNGNLKDITVTVASTVELYNKATGANISQRDVIEDIAKLSTRIQMQFKGNVKALTLQVIKAKQLGTTLDKIAAMGRASLEFEESIGKEMEARVLLGKNINLDAFRTAALNKDQATMMAEISKYAGSASEYANMNVIQQESLARALNLEVDELANMLEKSELLKTLGVEQLDRSAEQKIINSNLSEEKKKELLTQIQISDTTEKLAKASEGLRNIFAGLASALQPAIDLFATMLSHISSIKPIIEGIATTISIVMLPSLLKSVALTAAWALESAAVAIAQIASASALTLGLGAIGIAAGIAVAAAAYQSSKSSIKDGVIDSDGGLVVSGPKGSYSLDADDKVFASPNISTPKSEKTYTQSDTSRLEALLEKLIAKVDQPMQVVIGGRVIDEIDNRTGLRRSYTTKVDSGYGVFG